MPTADPAYIIGVIRHKELGLLGEDEYTRLIGAATAKEALHTLVDTPYNKWLDAGVDATQASQALNQRLVALQNWLTDVVEDNRLLEFIQVRYDALNLASALIDLSLGKDKPGVLSDLGSLSPTTIHSLFWHDTGWELLPDHWEEHLRSAQAMLGKNLPPKWQTKLLLFFQTAALTRLDTLAVSPLMRATVTLNRDRLVLDMILRQQTAPKDSLLSLSPLAQELSSDTSLDDISTVLARHNLGKFTTSAITGVRQHSDSHAYELAWDNYLMAEITKYRADPVGPDPILAFWLAQELEVKNLRLLLSAKLQGLSIDKIKPLQRNLYYAH